MRRSFKRDFPRRLGRLERRCTPPHASPAPPCVRASLTCPVPACAGLCHSTCPCRRCSFDATPRQPRRHLGARAPPRSPGRSRLTSPGAPALAKSRDRSVPALPLARPPSPPRPQPTCPCPLAGALVDHLVARAWRTTSTLRLQGWWPRSSTSGDERLRPGHPPRARGGEPGPSNLGPFA